MTKCGGAWHYYRSYQFGESSSKETYNVNICLSGADSTHGSSFAGCMMGESLRVR